ncbi:MAG TPA: hypothetical protein DDZ51_09985 [Planctomycetaceae bacterium]|nr:hypothetical protein [Planctomycetaceae bacterium]
MFVEIFYSPTQAEFLIDFCLSRASTPELFSLRKDDRINMGKAFARDLENGNPLHEVRTGVH